MSAASPKTLPPPAEVEPDLVAEQRALTLALTSHADPHVRLLAHISERQLAFNELLTEFKTALNKNTEAVAALTRVVEERGTRQDAHERRYPMNGDAAHSEHADAQ
jgi:hypothetical protein